MVKITSLKKSNKYWVLQTNDEKKVKLFEDVVVELRLTTKKQLSEEDLTKIDQLNNYYSGLDKSLNYLKRPRSKAEVIDYLTKDYEIGLIDKIVSYLLKHKFIDEQIIVDSILEEVSSNKMKERKIENKKIDLNNVIIDYPDEVEFAKIELNKYQARQKTWSRKDHVRAFRYLISKGYSSETVSIVLEISIYEDSI